MFADCSAIFCFQQRHSHTLNSIHSLVYAHLTLVGWLYGCKINKIECSSIRSLHPIQFAHFTSLAWLWWITENDSPSLQLICNVCALCLCMCVCLRTDAESIQWKIACVFVTMSKMNGKSLKRCFKNVYNIPKQYGTDWLYAYRMDMCKCLAAIERGSNDGERWKLSPVQWKLFTFSVRTYLFE